SRATRVIGRGRQTIRDQAVRHSLAKEGVLHALMQSRRRTILYSGKEQLYGHRVGDHDRMKVVILCGGQGTRLREEPEVRPKPMVEIGGRPILWHIMKLYAQHGLSEFVLCLGYKGHVIKDFFLNYETRV